MSRLVAIPPPRDRVWNPDLAPAVIEAPGTTAIMARLRSPGAVVVTTGQQPGLFTGPLYTLHKALSAATLAHELEHRWHRPVIPVFWLAADDHDYREASVARWPARDQSLVEWRLPTRDGGAPQLPVSAIPLDAAVDTGLDAFEHSLGAGVDRDRVMSSLRACYRPGVTLAAACGRALAEWLAPHGVVVLDASHSSVKRAQLPLLRAALEQAPELDRELAALPDAETGIAAGSDATLVFVTTKAGRDRLLIDGQGFRTRRSGDRFTHDALFRLLDHDPERFSANVLLRPVVEAGILPTMAYVAGPAEYKYLTRQSVALYPRFGLQPQTPVPRWSGTVVPTWADRLLDRLHCTAEQVIGDDGTVGAALLRRDLPIAAREALAVLRDQIAEQGAMLAATGAAIDPVLHRAIDGRTRRLGHVVDDIEHVLLRHLRRRDDTVYAQWTRLRLTLLPANQLQERVYIGPAFLGRDAARWIACVLAATADWAAQVPSMPEPA